MKNIFIIILVNIAIILMSCTSSESPQLSTNSTKKAENVELPSGQKVVNAVYGNYGVQCLTRPMKLNEVPETYTLFYWTHSDCLVFTIIESN